MVNWETSSWTTPLRDLADPVESGGPVAVLAELDPNRANGIGRTPLMIYLGSIVNAASPITEEIVQLLLDDARVDVNHRDSRGRTILHVAAHNGLREGSPGLQQRIIRISADTHAKTQISRMAREAKV